MTAEIIAEDPVIGCCFQICKIPNYKICLLLKCKKK